MSDPAKAPLFQNKGLNTGRNLRRILVVDDDEYVAMTIQKGLEKLPNCEVVATTEARRALDLFCEEAFDLLITDYLMPGMDGITLAAHIQEMCSEIITVIITAYGDNVLRDQTGGVSICCILDKPVKLTEIRSVALEALEGKSSPNAGFEDMSD